eukprot:scaffold860_cov141-Skeletonema_menzelii.AAC.5
METREYEMMSASFCRRVCVCHTKRHVDGGSKVSPYIKWETTDIGEMTNSESFAAIGTIEWTSVEDASKLI